MKYTAILVLDVLVIQTSHDVPYNPEFKREHWAVEAEFKNGITHPFSLSQDYDQGWQSHVDNHLFMEDRKDEAANTVWYAPQYVHRESMLYRGLPKFGFKLIAEQTLETQPTGASPH